MTKEIMVKMLGNTPLFKNISKSEISQILKKADSRNYKYQKDSFIFLAGESKPMIGIMLAGQAYVVRENYLGDHMIIEVLNAGDIFGETYAFLQTPKIPVSVRTTQDTEILLINMDKLIKAGASHEVLIRNMLRMMGEKNVLLNEKMSYITHKTIRERLKAYLYDQKKKNNSSQFHIPFNRNELADYLCIDRSAMSRELSNMKKEGIIDYYKNEFVLK